jgi:hypothetical protein
VNVRFVPKAVIQKSDIKKGILMKKLMLILMLVVVSSSAMAEWDLALKSADGATSYYIQNDAILKYGNKAKMWVLVDHKKIIKTNLRKIVFSYKAQFEYKCDEKHYRLLFKTTYPKNMGRGNIIDTFDEPDEWNPVIPESASETLLYKACAGRKLKLKR